ncbi:MAG: hypothetical protein HY516_02165 [Candidatus Aenigmarchaeota archaeon]|nr:hypothetical protein [Candidatus Aenigmarchaeota archaeon]
MLADERWEQLKISVAYYRTGILDNLRTVAGNKYSRFADYSRGIRVAYTDMEHVESYTAKVREATGGDVLQSYAEHDNITGFPMLTDHARMDVTKDGNVRMEPKRFVGSCGPMIFTREGLEDRSKPSAYGEEYGPLRCFLHELGHFVAWFSANMPKHFVGYAIERGVANKNGMSIYRKPDTDKQVDPACLPFMRLGAAVYILNETDAEYFAVNTLCRIAGVPPKATETWKSRDMAVATGLLPAELRRMFETDLDAISAMLRENGFGLGITPELRHFVAEMKKVPVIKRPVTSGVPAFDDAYETTTAGLLLGLY